MRALFFYAASGTDNPRVLGALQAQTSTTLRPFRRYLGQAIHTAKQRQTRYQLPWERVRDLRQVFMDPVGVRAWVPKRRAAWRFIGWPEDRELKLEQPVMVISRGVTHRVLACERLPGGDLRLSLDGELQEGDQVFWYGIPCEFEHDAGSEPPTRVCDQQGQALSLSRPPEEERGGWVLVLEGWDGEGGLVVDGDPVEPTTLSAFEGLSQVVDAEGRAFLLTSGTLKVEELPAQGELRGDNGLRFRWRAASQGRGGDWVQLLLPEDDRDAEGFLDPRAAFCEGDVREVWTQARHHPSTSFRVKRVDSERYQLLLDEVPPVGSQLYLPVDVRNLYLQRRALNQLAFAPLPHHQGLLRLCEDPDHVRWPAARAVLPGEWMALTDATRSGTDEQRAFVGKALGTPDVALLEGPPGSGKTTAICELVQQLISDGKRVLLCASTHVAIDNVLERLMDTDAPVDAVRIGRVERVDDNVQQTQIDNRVARLKAAWRQRPDFSALGDAELEEMATRTVVMASNLTCGTTMGIVNHPLFDSLRDIDIKERPITNMPHWDVLIVDEASKTLIQEFLVPALMAKRWVIVGDVRQLPPFADRADIVANLRSLVDEDDREVFPSYHQHACLLSYRLARPRLRGTRARWLVVEPPGVLDFLEKEFEAREVELMVTRVVSRRRQRGVFREVTVQQLRRGEPEALLLAASDWVVVNDDCLAEAAEHLPADLLHHRDLTRGEHALPESHPLLFRHAWWLDRAGRLTRSYRERSVDITTFAEAEAHERRWLSERDLALEMTWRLTRMHELKRSHDQRERERLIAALEEMMPRAVDIYESLREIYDIGLPSILEVVQEGIGEERTSRPSALTEGMRRRRGDDFLARFGSLTFQHRMHPDISAFPRAVLYGGQALQDANTIAERDQEARWSFGDFRGRRVWMDVEGRERGGVNEDEVRVMERLVRDFLGWAQRVEGPRGRAWEVACLCFYTKQERAISRMLQRVSGDDRHTRFSVGGVELVCGTVDRFQGREADLVLLSMRNTGRIGFLDSPNRLNVAITRARQQLIVIGNARYFQDCRIHELKELVRQSPREDGRRWLGRGR